jgi:hypothetical protein
MTQAADAQGHSVASRIAGIVLALVGGLVWLLPVLGFVFIVPRFVQVFDELGVALPVLARYVIGASGVVAHYWPIFAAPLAAVTMGLVVGSVVGKTRVPVGLSVAFSVVSLLMVIAVQTLLVMGLFLPLASVVQAMA